jgi:hypothetical protein
MKARALAAAWLAVSSSLAGCGYAPAYGGQYASERLCVVPAPPKVSDPDALQAALTGARSELSRAGALRTGGGYPRMVVELLRIDELSSGIAAVPAQPGAGAMPLARGENIGVVGRAWVQGAPGAEPTRDTGDVRRVEHAAGEQDPRVDALARDGSVRAAAGELGRALARRVLGEPEPTVEPM